jgi:hypothetical protein
MLILLEGLLKCGGKLQAYITKYGNLVWSHVYDINVVSLGFPSEHLL